METVSLARSFPAGSGEARPISISRALGKVVVTVRGDVDADLAQILHRVLVDLVDGLGSLYVILDLRHVGRIDPIGIETVIDITERAARRGATLAVSEPYRRERRGLQASFLGAGDDGRTPGRGGGTASTAARRSALRRPRRTRQRAAGRSPR